jgi:hypothetical protein
MSLEKNLLLAEIVLKTVNEFETNLFNAEELECQNELTKCLGNIIKCETESIENPQTY